MRLVSRQWLLDLLRFWLAFKGPSLFFWFDSFVLSLQKKSLDKNEKYFFKVEGLKETDDLDDDRLNFIYNRKYLVQLAIQASS